jgi:diadenylate cyclase
MGFISGVLTNTMMDFACRIAEQIEAKAVMLYGDAVKNDQLPEVISERDLIIVTRGDGDDALWKYAKIIKIPNLKLTRVGQIKISIIKGIAAGLLRRQDRVVCLTGIPKLGYIDCMMVIDVGREFEILTAENASDIFAGIQHEVFEAVLTLALELGSQGREGRPVGTIFILGDHERVFPFTRQMIINPFAGYPEEERNILNPMLKETVREFSALDGAFIIKGDGVLMTAGSYLNVTMEGKDFPRGLGSRHLAASGITTVTDAVAIVVSESTGTVRVFKNGRIFVSIEKPVE